MRSLIVDDEFVAVQKLACLLQPFGEFITAMDAKSALEEFDKAHRAERPFELITVDIEMPDMHGLELLRRIREREHELSTKPAIVFMVSCASTPINVENAAMAGCSGFLVKPVRRHLLLERLAEQALIPANVLRHH